MALNREQRRAQLKQLGKKFSGIDITKGVVDIPIIGGGETLKLDLMSYDSVFYLTDICDKFSNLEENYKADFQRIDSIEDEQRKTIELVRLYKKVIDDFRVSVDNLFGEGATFKIFGNNTPMPQVIGEFIEDLTPVLTAMRAVIDSEGVQSNGVQSILSSSNIKNYSGDRLGNV